MGASVKRVGIGEVVALVVAVALIIAAVVFVLNAVADHECVGRYGAKYDACAVEHNLDH
jgi:hypothetical protein